jgi:hypothetical protein
MFRLADHPLPPEKICPRLNLVDDPWSVWTVMTHYMVVHVVVAQKVHSTEVSMTVEASDWCFGALDWELHIRLSTPL